MHKFSAALIISSLDDTHVNVFPFTAHSYTVVLVHIYFANDYSLDWTLK